jgi:hypothetical protein
MKDLKHYLSLMAILSVGLGLFWMFNFHRMAQIWITIGLGITYVIWGIAYHAIKKELHWRIVWEYIVVAIVACVLVIFLLMRT